MNKISTLSPGLAREYSAGSTYEAGQYVLWRNAYWKCSVAIPVPEEWTPGHWTKDDSPLDHKADLVDGKVPAAQLPSYVDDILEYDAKDVSTVAAFRSDRSYAAGSVVKHGSPAKAYVFTAAHPAGAWTGEDVRDAELFPATGEKGKIYVALNTDTQYRWSGSAYVELAKYIPPYTSRPEMDGNASAGSADSYARGDHRHPTDTSRASVEDATLTEHRFTAWAWEGTPPTYEGKEVVLRLKNYPWPDDDPGRCWVAYTVDGEPCGLFGDPAARDDDNTRTTVTVAINEGGGYHTATRTALQGYILGPDDPSKPNYDKPLASEAEAEALRTEVAGKASTADATLTERGFGAWVLADNVNNPITGEWLEEWQRFSPSATSGEVTIVNNEIYVGGVSATAGQDVSQDGLSLVFNGFGWANLGNALGISVGDTVATRTVVGYVLGSQTDKPLASEAEAEALRTEVAGKADDADVIHTTGNETKTGSLTINAGGNGSVGVMDVNSEDGTVKTSLLGVGKMAYAEGNTAYIYTFPSSSGTFALAAPNTTAGNLAALDSRGNPTNSGWTAGDLARYSLVTKTISGGAVTLDDRADNYVDARALGSSDSLDVDFPALVNGKARDFVLAVECGANPPTISYAAFVTIMAEDASSLAPEEGMNIYAFTEFKANMFLASRKTVSTVVANTL